MDLDALIGTGTPVGGRLVLARVDHREGPMYRTRCVGLAGRPCGFEAVIAGRLLRAGKRLRCINCAQTLRRWLVSTPTGAEFAARRKRRARRIAERGLA